VKSYIVANAAELRHGAKKTVTIDGKSISIFNVQGEFYALRDVCPHQGAPLGKGKIVGIHECGENLDDIRLVKQGEVIRCPWHGWEFDIKTGQSIFDPQGCFLKTYAVSLDKEQEGAIIIHI
jgi:nitrite reductase (NADH) small subunit